MLDLMLNIDDSFFFEKKIASSRGHASHWPEATQKAVGPANAIFSESVTHICLVPLK